ncbi:CDP-alcohol phosphatidyltransferase family protein [Epilithonimonas zeae]|uniref:CDP-alcohol phosphatidyltransferase family protein n=1 Tax=Epilithonimonas zeae TaxID=1416779 RepID=UPI00200BBFB4|nr:CDP-alcohol phosphatidyltransferase family protein [Epilithonimonas zeae]UQB68433.1 CDP-alcohol phosphatidyltransferase family protein [Epilithonimonas zeae]
MKTIPYLLILLRFLSAIAILYLGYFVGEKSRNMILALMYFGLLTDIFDGIIARKAGVSSEKLRRLDSQTDLVFWLTIGFSTYWLNSEIIKYHWKSISFIFGMEALCYIISFWKFGKETCTHAWLSKLWGLSLLIAFTFLISFSTANWAFYLCLILGLISHIDVILIVLILPKWKFDVPSSYHAWKIRQGKSIRKSVLLN